MKYIFLNKIFACVMVLSATSSWCCLDSQQAKTNRPIAEVRIETVHSTQHVHTADIKSRENQQEKRDIDELQGNCGEECSCLLEGQSCESDFDCCSYTEYCLKGICVIENASN